MSDLHLTVAYFLHFELKPHTCWAKHLQIFTEPSLGYDHSPDVKISLVVCTNSIYGYTMFCAISRNAFLVISFELKQVG